MGSHGTVWLFLKQPFVALVDHVRVLRNPYGSRTSSYGCSQAHKAYARAPYGTRRVEVRTLTIPKNTDNPQNARMHVAKKADFIHIENG